MLRATVLVEALMDGASGLMSKHLRKSKTAQSQRPLKSPASLANLGFSLRWAVEEAL